MGRTESVRGRRQYYDDEAVSFAGDDDLGHKDGREDDEGDKGLSKARK